MPCASWCRPAVDAAKFRNPELPHFHPGDLEIALDIDRYDFAIRVATEAGLPVARAVGGQTGRAQPVDAAQPDAQLQMVWPEHLLSAPPAAPLPPGYTLRTYRPGDRAALLRGDGARRLAGLG